jgi:hypothetical protein
MITKLVNPTILLIEGAFDVEFNNDTMLGQIVKNESKFIQKAVETILY